MADIASGFGSVHSMAPLHAKWGWIVALGIVYVVAGFIALGSVVMATAAAVWVVGIMMIIAGVTEVISAFQVKTWGRFFFWLLLGPLHFRRLRRVREHLADCHLADADPRRGAGRLRHRARSSAAGRSRARSWRDRQACET